MAEDSSISCESKILSRTVSENDQDICVFALYAGIQDGRQKWRENDFWQKLPDEFEYALWDNIWLKLLAPFKKKSVFLRFCPEIMP